MAGVSLRLVTFSVGADASARIGAWLGEDIFDLGLAYQRAESAGVFPATMRSLIELGQAGLDMARTALDWAAGNKQIAGIRHAAADVRLLPPVPNPSKFFCVGKNNKTHIQELVDNQLIKEIPKEPTGFVKLHDVIVGDNAAVVRPDGITTLDYEPELVFVVGKRAFQTKREEALSHVFGITLTNDLTAREIQKREVASGTRFWTAKNMPGFGPVGPYLLAMDEVTNPHDLWITCMVNGQQRMRTHTGDMIFRIEDVIEHFSRWMPLEPGDLFAMGAPAGVAVGQPNAQELFLKPGDKVEIAFEGQPALRTRIVSPTEKVE